MQKKLRITVEGKVYDVTVEELTETGQAAPAHPAAAGIGAGTGAPTIAVPPGPLAAPPPPAPSHAPAGSAPAGAVICPLGGVVDSVEVAVGQKVAEGDRVCVVEAMKMKTPIHAHAGGTIASIAIKPGDAVEAGTVLMTIG